MMARCDPGATALPDSPADSREAAAQANPSIIIDRLDVKQATLVLLPKDKAKRVECYKELKQYCQELKIDVDPSDLKDDGDPYIEVEIR